MCEMHSKGKGGDAPTVAFATISYGTLFGNKCLSVRRTTCGVSMQQGREDGVKSTSRRQLLRLLPLATSACLPILSANAIQSGEIHSELSDLASNIPGGMSDVYYPDFFLGEWLVSRDLYAVETFGNLPEAPGHSVLSERALEMLRNRIGIRETFHARFVNHRQKIVEDRLYNSKEDMGAFSDRVKVVWDRDYPNILTQEWGVGKLREVKVTSRAFVDAPQGYGTFISSEYARVVEIENEGAKFGFGKPPSIYGRRRIVRYTVSSVTEKIEPDGMDRIVVDYVYAPSEVLDRPSVVMKYRDFFNRKRGSQLVVG